MSDIDFGGCSAHFAWLTEALRYLKRGSFSTRLLFLEIIMSVNLIDEAIWCSVHQ